MQFFLELTLGVFLRIENSSSNLKSILLQSVWNDLELFGDKSKNHIKILVLLFENQSY